MPVLIKFTPTSTESDKRAWADSLAALKDLIPQVKDIKIGTKIPHVKDGGWDNGAILIFDNKSDLDIYAKAKPHVDYQAATADLTLDKLIFDIEV
ncbi:hypothetical protein SISSUDRAFT_1058431 [Sistotremastrum suecicum HHB10207 ss-3]|uniref:Stress-response A/B barrel domain-containing protein n=1 Tax=Sistotremastrum suecicum HHB10207 ss-3 TaxID=1314776 RepID=A0A166HFI8_9AGAM|nr:hypothetical protein SISSUDRAFT_1058431 [Sistotremastrum suecicum HHB10207 ss-3]